LDISAPWPHSRTSSTGRAIRNAPFSLHRTWESDSSTHPASEGGQEIEEDSNDRRGTTNNQCPFHNVAYGDCVFHFPDFSNSCQFINALLWRLAFDHSMQPT
jgi:hypothetical protein